MSRTLWLLVEWVDERDVFPNYGVVHVGSLIGSETQLHVGKFIYVRDKIGNNPRRAQVLRISDNKRYVKEQRKLVEREDHQVKNVLSLCMRTIREMKSGSMYTSLMNDQHMSPNSSSGSALPHVVADTDSSSDADEPHRDLSRRHRKQTVTPRFDNREATSNSTSGKRLPTSRHLTPHQRSRSMVCSTPVSTINGTCKPSLTFDQGTQTDIQEHHRQKLEEMEEVIKGLYSRFMTLVSHMQNDNVTLSGTEQEDIDISEAERNGTLSSPEQNGRHSDLNSGQPNGEFISNAKTLQVRRVSAHTTNTAEQSFGNENEMVPIGAGNAMVPRRLLNDIDWTSYSTSTRQLLQAMFPRRVLATHSLTGKQSPAFTNKPPKKRLDPLIVNDIVDTVAERCGVSKRLVRSSITIKCTDESKLYRNRQLHKHARLEHQNQENVPPLTSDDSSTVTE